MFMSPVCLKLDPVLGFYQFINEYSNNQIVDFRNATVIASALQGSFVGSITQLQDGSPYLLAGPNIIVSTGSNGQITLTPTRLGNSVLVDSVYGNDSTAARGIGPYKTPNAALNAMQSGDTMFVAPGTYELSSPLVMKSNTAIRGSNVQTTTIQMTNVTGSTTLLTVEDNCRIEDITLTLTSNQHVNLTAMLFTGSASVSSKLRTAVVNVSNNGAGYNGTSNVVGALFVGSGTLNDGNFSFNCLKGSTINVRSLGTGSKRGVLLSGSCATSIRDVNIYVSGSTISSGTFYGVETLYSNSEFQCRSSTIFGTTADISQTSGSIIVGPGTDLVNKSANSLSFTCYQTPNTMYFGALGSLSSSALTTMYLTPGTCPIQPAWQTGGGKWVAQYPSSYPVTNIMQTKTLVLGMHVSCSVGPGTGTTKVTILKNGTNTAITGSLTDGITGVSCNHHSVTYNQNDLLAVKVESTGTNTTQDLVVQVNMY